jgi:hypothetical protein
MVTGSIPISQLPTGTIDNLQAVFPLSIGMPSAPQTIQVSLAQLSSQVMGTQFAGTGTVTPVSGWVGLSGTVTRVSAVSGTMSGDWTGILSQGVKMQWTQFNQTKYGVISATSFGGGQTNIGFIENTDYPLLTGTSSGWMYSRVERPHGFPSAFNWSPTWNFLVVGNGTQVARWQAQGSWIDYTIEVNFGTTSKITGAVVHALPYTPEDQTSSFLAIGNAVLHDFATAIYYGASVIQGGVITIRVVTADATYAYWGTISATIPFTWTNTDQVILNGRYKMNV